MIRLPYRLIAGLASLSFAFFAAPATAATDPGSPTLTDVHLKDGVVSAVLTMPGAASDQAVDRGSLQVSLGNGSPVQAGLVPVARERRAALVVIDTSGSMAGPGLAAAKSAALAFLDAVPADVEVGLASFAQRPHLLVAPTTHRAPVRQALGRLRALGATSLYDALTVSLRKLGHDGSRTVVLLSDGADTASRTSLSAIEAMMRASGVRPAVVGFHTGGSQNNVLRQLAHAGGGAVTEALDPASLRQAFGSAAREIAAQVRLAVPVPNGVSGAQRLTVAGTVQGRSFTTSISVVLPAIQDGSTARTVTKATPVVAAPAQGSSRLLWIAALAVFAGLLGLGFATAAPQLTPAAKRRLRALDDYLTPADRQPAKDAASSLQGLSDGLTRAADAYIGKRESAARTGLMLERADMPLQLNEWYVLRVLAVPISAALCWVLFRDSGGRVVLTLIGTALLGGAIPPLLLRYAANKRARKFELQLPDVLTLVASSLTTGFSLPQALDGITRDAAEPAAKEFSRALAETRIGVDLEDALDRTAERMGSTNLAWTTMAVRIQRRVGGNLADVMRTTAKTLRDRESLRRQVRALSAEGRLSAYILVALPLLMAVYLYVANRSYLSLLWHRSLGVVMLAISSVLLVIGVFWMRRIANVKV